MVFLDIETTDLKPLSPIYQFSAIVTSPVFEIEAVVNKYLTLTREAYDSAYMVSLPFDELNSKANGYTLQDLYEENKHIFLTGNHLTIAYGTAFDLPHLRNVFHSIGKQVEWGQEIYTLDRCQGRTNLCAMKLVRRKFNPRYNLPLGRAIDVALSESKQLDFGLFAKEYCLDCEQAYHDSMFDTFMLFNLLKANRAWLY